MATVPNFSMLQQMLGVLQTLIFLCFASFEVGLFCNVTVAFLLFNKVFFCYLVLISNG
jgi:hypothetical protein